MLHTCCGKHPSDARAVASSPSPRIWAMIVAAVSHEISSVPIAGLLVFEKFVVVGGQKQSAVVGQSGSSIVTSDCGLGGGQQPWLCVSADMPSDWLKAGIPSCDRDGGDECVLLGLA